MNYITRLRNTIILGFSLAACTAQQNKDGLQLYQEAMERYEAKDYYDALQLFKEAIPILKGKKEIITAQFCQAYAYFHEKSYKFSAHCFGEFYKTYPRLEQAEEALYMEGYSYYLDIPDVRLDQQKTEKGRRVFDLYLSHYPAGVYHEKADEYRKKLNDQLALKAFKNAKLYFDLDQYQSAVIALNNFQQSYPTSTYLEKAAYLKIKSQYAFAVASEPSERLTKLRTCMAYYRDFLNHYAESQYVKKLHPLYVLTIDQIDHSSTKP